MKNANADAENLTTDQFFSSRYAVFVGFLFAVVIGQSFAKYEDVLFQPSDFPLEFTALIGLYGFVLLSWAGYQRSLKSFPYTTGLRSVVRLAADFMIVVFYVFMLRSLGDIKSNSATGNYILGYLFSFGGYILSGWARQWDHSHKASKITGLYIVFAIYALLYGIHYLVTTYNLVGLTIVNWTTVFLAIVVTVGWRLWRKIGGAMGL